MLRGQGSYCHVVSVASSIALQVDNAVLVLSRSIPGCVLELLQTSTKCRMFLQGHLLAIKAGEERVTSHWSNLGPRLFGPLGFQLLADEVNKRWAQPT